MASNGPHSGMDHAPPPILAQLETAPFTPMHARACCATNGRFARMEVGFSDARRRSSVAQWQSIRLLTGGLLVRVQPEEPNPRVRVWPPHALLGKRVASRRSAPAVPSPA